jgi:hypothetical protein
MLCFKLFFKQLKSLCKAHQYMLTVNSCWQWTAADSEQLLTVLFAADLHCQHISLCIQLYYCRYNCCTTMQKNAQCQCACAAVSCLSQRYACPAPIYNCKIKQKKLIKVIIIFLHTNCHTCDMFRSIFIIFRQILQIKTTYKQMWTGN